MEKWVNEYKEITLEDTVFIVDIDKLELRQKDNPANLRSYLEMSRRKDDFLMEMNVVTKSISRENAFIEDDQDIKGICVPQMKDIDPEGVARKYNKTIDQVKASTDFELWLEANAVSERLNVGRLPMMEIKGDLYYVDMRMGIIRPRNNFISYGIPIEFDYPDRRSVSFYLNTKTQEQHIPDYSATVFPKNVIQVSVPGAKYLDPVGYARELGMDANAFLNQVPLVMYHRPKITPIQRTEYGQKIRKNQLNKQISKPQKKAVKVRRKGL